jgi:hypothetical protein
VVVVAIIAVSGCGQNDRQIAEPEASEEIGEIEAEAETVEEEEVVEEIIEEKEEPQEPEPAPKVEEEPARASISAITELAQKLAVVHTGRSVDSKDSIVGEFETLLFLIERKVTQNEKEVADILVKAWELIGKKRTLLDVFKDIDALLPDTGERDLLDVATKYVASIR